MSCKHNLIPIWPGEGGGEVVFFFAITQKVFELGSSNFLTFLTKTCPSLKAKYWTLHLLPESADILPKCLILPIPD